MTSMELAFWLSVAVVGYVYVGYPSLLLVWNKLRPRPVAKRDIEPTVSIVIAARNERGRIGDKAGNCLALDYPREKLQILVALDGPTDGTDEALRDAEERGVEVVHLPVHRGKAAALNAAVKRARGDVVVFTDARQRLALDAVRQLVANFVDESVGAVSGKLVITEDDGEESGDGVGLYWRYERRIRALESGVHSVVGATGALYAIRRHLFRPLSPETILDDVAVPMSLVLSGRRVLYDESARAFERPTHDMAREYRRRVRTLAGNYQLMAQMPALLDPNRNPVFLQFVSHKLGRLVVPYFLVLAFVSNCFLPGGFYTLTLAAQLALPLMAALGVALARNGEGEPSAHPPTKAMRVMLFAGAFLALNWAAVVGLYHFLAGRAEIRQRVWSDDTVDASQRA